jgi:hypothetical protein
MILLPLYKKAYCQSFGSELLQDSLKAEISAGAKTKVLDLEPDEEQQGHYTASFIPDIETTY